MYFGCKVDFCRIAITANLSYRTMIVNKIKIIKMHIKRHSMMTWVTHRYREWTWSLNRFSLVKQKGTTIELIIALLVEVFLSIDFQHGKTNQDSTLGDFRVPVRAKMNQDFWHTNHSVKPDRGRWNWSSSIIIAIEVDRISFDTNYILDYSWHYSVASVLTTKRSLLWKGNIQ